MTYIYLSIAIVAEVIATSALKASAEFTKLWPSLTVIFGYGISFYFLTIALRVIPVGIAYAIWSGVGIVLIAIAGLILYEQTLDLPAITGIVLILAGVIVINVFSNSVSH